MLIVDVVGFVTIALDAEASVAALGSVRHDQRLNRRVVAPVDAFLEVFHIRLHLARVNVERVDLFSPFVHLVSGTTLTFLESQESFARLRLITRRFSHSRIIVEFQIALIELETNRSRHRRVIRTVAAFR